MKALLILFVLTAGLSFEGKSETSKTGEHKSATATQLSHAQEMELLDDYFPEHMQESNMDLVTIKIYDSNFDLVIEETINPLEIMENQKLEAYLMNSELMMDTDNTSLYMLER